MNNAAANTNEIAKLGLSDTRDLLAQKNAEIEELKKQLAEVKAARSKRNSRQRVINSRNADLKEEIAAVAAKGVTSFNAAVANIDKIADLAEKIWHLPASFAPDSMFN